MQRYGKCSQGVQASSWLVSALGRVGGRSVVGVCLALAAVACGPADAAGLAVQNTEQAGLTDPCRPAGYESIFGNYAPEGTQPADDSGAVTLVVVLAPKVSGEIRGVRFYRTTPGGFPANGFQVAIWTLDGTRAAYGYATIGQNPSSGWMTGPLYQHVRVQAGEQYVASYYAPQGSYDYLHDGLAQWADAPYLAVPASGGLYTNGSGETLPASSYLSSNYFVDVSFIPDTPVADPCRPDYSQTIFGICPPEDASTADDPARAGFQVSRNSNISRVIQQSYNC